MMCKKKTLILQLYHSCTLVTTNCCFVNYHFTITIFSMCKSLAYLLLYFVYFMSMLLRSCCCKFKIALDKHSGDYLRRLFLLLSGEVGIQKNLYKYIILGLCGILRFSLLLFSSQTNPFSSTKQRLFSFVFRLLLYLEAS